MCLKSCFPIHALARLSPQFDWGSLWGPSHRGSLRLDMLVIFFAKICIVYLCAVGSFVEDSTSSRKPNAMSGQITS